MFFKLLTVALIFLAAAWMLAGWRTALPPGGGVRPPARVPRADDLVACGRCGVWLPAGQRCDCPGPAGAGGARVDETRIDGA